MTFSYEYINVMNMKKILFSLLILSMVTPMLVCSTGFGMKNAKAAVPCHDEHPGEQADSTSDGIMFMLDCMKTDLFSADGGESIKKSDQSFEYVSYDLTHLTTSYQVIKGQQNARAPPGYLLKTAGFSPPIILTTQRFRI